MLLSGKIFPYVAIVAKLSPSAFSLTSRKLSKNLSIWEGNLDDIGYEDDPGLWFLARSVDGNRLLLVHT